MKAFVASLLMWLAVVVRADEVSFSRDVVPVLRIHCAHCHISDEAPGGMSLYPAAAAYKSLVGVEARGAPKLRVAPGNQQESYLWHKITGTHIAAGGSGGSMPFGLPLLSEDIRELIERWITQGALNN